MLMNDEIIFDRYYCINSAQTKEIMGLHILQPHHISIRLKVFILMLVPGGLQLPIISMCFAWCSVTSINQRTNGPVNAHLSLLHIPINMFEYYGI